MCWKPTPGQNFDSHFNWRKCYSVGAEADVGSNFDSIVIVEQQLNLAIGSVDWAQLWPDEQCVIECVYEDDPYDRNLVGKSS